MMDLTARLSGLRNEKKQADDTRLRKQGELDSLMTQLKDKFGFTDEAKARKALLDKSAKATALRTKLEQEITTAEQKLHPPAVAYTEPPLTTGEARARREDAEDKARQYTPALNSKNEEW